MERAPESYLRDVLPENPRSVLDVGTGHSGVFDFWEWESKSLDLKACSDIHQIRKDIPDTWLKVIADGCNLPFNDNTFDVVQCTETLEHVPPDKRETFLRELQRVSRDLIYITTSGLAAHVGEEQKRAEQINPFQKFQGFPPSDLLKSHGFHVLFEEPDPLDNYRARIRAFKRKIPEWDSAFKDMADYAVELTRNAEVESVLDVGTGSKGVVAQDYYEETKQIKRGYTCDIWAIKALPPAWIPLKMNALDLPKVLGQKSVDVVQAFGFLEHLTKEDGHRFLRIAEWLARKFVILSAATYVHGPTPDYKAKMEGNPYHYYHSTWHWKEFEELGYETNFEDMRKGVTFSEEAIAWKRL